MGIYLHRIRKVTDSELQFFNTFGENRNIQFIFKDDVDQKPEIFEDIMPSLTEVIIKQRKTDEALLKKTFNIPEDSGLVFIHMDDDFIKFRSKKTSKLYTISNKDYQTKYKVEIETPGYIFYVDYIGYWKDTEHQLRNQLAELYGKDLLENKYCLCSPEMIKKLTLDENKNGMISIIEESDTDIYCLECT